MTYDDVGGPLARGRDAAEPIGGDTVEESGKDMKALAEHLDLLIPMLCQRGDLGAYRATPASWRPTRRA